MAAAAGVAVAALATWTAWRLAAVIAAEPGVPLWDAAAHGLAGADVARAIRAGNPLALLGALNAQVLWPFVHSLLLAPAFLVFGERWAVGDCVSAALLGATALAMFAAGLALHPRRGAWVGALAAVLVLLAPIGRFLGTVTMLEVPGAFLLACAIALHARCDREPVPRGPMIAAGVFTSALFLCKYNYGLLWLVPLAAFECGLLERERGRAVLSRVVRVVRHGRAMRPFPLLMLCWLAVMALVLVTGGTDLTLAGRHVSVRSPGNMAYAFLVVLLAWGLLRWRRDPARARQRWRALPQRQRLLAASVGAPLTLWFLVPWPNRVKELFGFVINRSAGAPAGLFDRLLFYPRAFVHEYAPHPALGAVLLLLALLPPLPGNARRREHSLLYFALLVGLLSETVHHYQQPRFLFTTAPLIWLCAALNAVALAERAAAPGHRHADLLEPVWVAALAATLAWGWLGAPADALTRERRRAFQSPESFTAVVDRVLADTRRGTGRCWLLGYGVRLSPGLLIWRAAETLPGDPRAHVPSRLPWMTRGAADTAIAARLAPLLAPGVRVVAALPAPGCTVYSRGDRDEVWADSVTAELVANSPGVVTESDTLLAGAGVRVRAFRAGGAGSSGR